MKVRWQVKNLKTNEKTERVITEGFKDKLEELAKRIFEEALRKL